MKLTIHEIAQSLYLPMSTVRRWIRQGRIPIHKSGGDYVFNEAILKKWAAAHHLTFSPPQKTVEKAQALKTDTLVSAMKRGGVFHDIKGTDAAEVLKAAVEIIPVVSNNTKENLYGLLLERENLTSTGIGKGVAIPHPHRPLAEDDYGPVITTCFLEKPIDFAAIDDKPVFVMFILLCPTVKQHLHLLSRLAFCVRDEAFVEFLRTYPGSDAFFLKIIEFEKRIDKSTAK
jgi:PTS system nitrogen regulatory IIA component